jgi:hypothetical protein
MDLTHIEVLAELIRNSKKKKEKKENLTSHVPIFNILAGKFEAFSRSPAVDMPDLLSFFLEGSEPLLSIEDSPALDA